ncbi:fumarate hydratase C-terminal domain-containing protein, partial [Salmonella enterica]|uniref:fumarate hydratase C-terminal domain-containing protein n=1 Tax=Salmonella enterica TaxID=28901 RepID=UPI000A708A55
LDNNPGQYSPTALQQADEGHALKDEHNGPMKELLTQLSQYPVPTRLSLTVTTSVDRYHTRAKPKEHIESFEDLTQSIKDHPICCTGPAKTPAGKPSGKIDRTTAGRRAS